MKTNTLIVSVHATLTLIFIISAVLIFGLGTVDSNVATFLVIQPFLLLAAAIVLYVLDQQITSHLARHFPASGKLENTTRLEA